MHKMSNLEYSFIVRELGQALNGKHFGRIRKIGGSTYRMKIAGLEVICELGVRLHATKYIEPAESDKFTEKVEKELDNARLSEIKQINNDRIVSFAFDKGELVFEMFGDGNAILVKDGKTVCAHKYESWSDRDIKAGAPYKPPKTAPAGRLEVTDKYIIVSLMKLPLGKDYAMEALSRAEIDEKAPGNSLSGNRILALEQEIAKLQSEAKPVAFSEGGKIADFALARLSKYSKLETSEPKTLSEAADEYYAHVVKTNPKLEKLKERYDKQAERLAELREEEKANKEKGDFIYANYQKAEDIIALAKAGKEQELEKKHNGKMDKKEKSVEADL
ncbi:NFACT family protein [Candidatus Micrarchaeota archaeon]|nr:NFACT family protein [Candidatus Micrarchaeota archaeon]